MPAKKARARKPAPKKPAARKKVQKAKSPKTPKAPKTPKTAKPAKTAAPATKSTPTAGKKPVLPFFEWKKGDAIIRVGVLSPFSYDEKKIRRWPDAYSDVEAFNSAHGTELTIARHEVVDRLLQDEVIGGMLATTLAPMLVRGLLVHEAPGTAFAAEVVAHANDSTTVIASTGRYAGQTDVALWLPDPSPRDFVRDARGVVVSVDDARWIPVAQPPLAAGWYHLDPKTLVPCGLHSEETPRKVAPVEGDDAGFALVPHPETQARYVIANSAGRAEVGPIVRDSNPARASVGYGLGSVTVLVELTDEDAARVTLTPAAQVFRSPFG